MRKMEVQSRLMGEESGKMNANRLVYDEDISQTDMEAFMSAICGRDVPPNVDPSLSPRPSGIGKAEAAPEPVAQPTRKRAKVAVRQVENVACPGWKPS